MKSLIGVQFFKVLKGKQEWLGERYFKVTYDSDTVVQVCASFPREARRGRQNTIGIHVIGRVSFASNYYSSSYVVPCTAKEYKKKFDEVVKMLRP